MAARRTETRCSFTKPDGTRCKATTRPGRSTCPFHDPELADQRAEGRRRGGEARMAPAPSTLPPDTPDARLATASDVRSFLAETLNQVRTGRLAANVGNCLFVGAGVLLKAIQGDELERRLAALEGKAKYRRRAG